MLSALYSFAGKAGYVPEEYNPARGIEKFPERARERFLTSDELARLGIALRQGETIGQPMRSMRATQKRSTPLRRITAVSSSTPSRWWQSAY
jgi:hypothetical protein